MTLGEKLKKFRISHNMTQKEMADSVGIEVYHYCNIENDKSGDLRPSTIRKIANAICEDEMKVRKYYENNK